MSTSFGNPADPWSLATTSYDPDRFYTRATDGNGHDANVQTKVSPALMGQITHLLDSRAVPDYRTKADVIRDSLVHRLVYLNQQFPGAVNLADLEIEQKQAELDKFATQRDAWKKYLEDLDDQLTNCINDNDFDVAEYIMEQHAFNESMTPPYLVRLSQVLSRHRQAIENKIAQGVRAS